MKIPIITLVLLAMITVSCTQHDVVPPLHDESLDKQLMELLESNSDGVGATHYILPSNDDFSKIPQDPNNPLTRAKVELGKLLFHDPVLAINSKFEMYRKSYSCATCHHHQAGFQSGRIQGISEGGSGFGIRGENRVKDDICPEDSLDIQPIRSPATLNSAYQAVMLWNGQFGATGPNAGTQNLWTPGTPLETNFLGYQGIETQAIAGLTVHRMGIAEELLEITDYKEMFDAAFPDIPLQERYTNITAGLAMAAYERTILANEAPFQYYLKGNNTALSDIQKKGAILFFGKANCAQCHNGPALNSMAFYGYGMKDLKGEGVYGNNPDLNTIKGRGGFTGSEQDENKFKVPQLYNMKTSGFLGHGSSFTKVEDVVRYKNTGIKENELVPDEHLAEAFAPLGLSEAEIIQLTAFLENGLYDTNLSRYEPDYVPSGLCFPNNDEASRMDLGCILP